MKVSSLQKKKRIKTVQHQLQGHHKTTLAAKAYDSAGSHMQCSRFADKQLYGCYQIAVMDSLKAERTNCPI